MLYQGMKSVPNISLNIIIKPEVFCLKILTGKKHRQLKLQRLQKVRIWAFRLLVHQINFLQEVLQLKQNFEKDKVVTGKAPFFEIGPFYTHHSICLNIGL